METWSGSFLVLGWQHQSQRGFLYYTYMYIFRLIRRLYGYISSGHDAQNSYAVRATSQVWRPSYYLLRPMHINWPIQYNMCRVWTLLVRRPRHLVAVASSYKLKSTTSDGTPLPSIKRDGEWVSDHEPCASMRFCVASPEASAALIVSVVD